MAASLIAAALSLAALVHANGGHGHGATISVDPHTTYQDYDGTGCSEAFQRSLLVYRLSEDARTEVLDYLFTEKGAGLTILRNGIGSTPNQPFDYMKSIAPTAPASNASEVRPLDERSLGSRRGHSGLTCSQLNYIPLPRGDQRQVWLAKQAKARGVNYIYADAWSADGYMSMPDTVSIQSSSAVANALLQRQMAPTSTAGTCAASGTHPVKAATGGSLTPTSS